MKIYCGAVGGSKALSFMAEKNYGLMLTPHSWKNANKSCVPWQYWALDNGAYRAYTRNTEFDEERFLNTVYNKLPKCGLDPDFITVPDIVASKESFKFSLKWRERLSDLNNYSWYLVVQDGMVVDQVEKEISKFDGLFVGGTVKWKIATGKDWIELAHSYSLPCHIGKVGTYKRLVWAIRIGADSIDSTAFSRNTDGFRRLESSQLQTILVK